MAMRNQYRVDRSDSLRVPCGMNSLLYIGNDLRAAELVFAQAVVGLDAWGKSDASYGVILSAWDNAERWYRVQRHKGELS